MTGQVKEDIITRFGELGVIVKDGCIGFKPQLLSKDEFLDTELDWKINERIIKLRKRELGFSLCGIPVIYSLGNSKSITIEMTRSEKKVLTNTHWIDSQISKLIFNRTGSIRCIRVELPENA